MFMGMVYVRMVILHIIIQHYRQPGIRCLYQLQYSHRYFAFYTAWDAIIQTEE